VTNLAGLPGSQNLLSDLSGRLDRWSGAFGDLGDIQEAPSEIAIEAQKMQEYHVIGMRAQGITPDITDEAFVAWWEAKLLGRKSPGYHARAKR